MQRCLERMSCLFQQCLSTKCRRIYYVVWQLILENLYWKLYLKVEYDKIVEDLILD